MFSRTTRFLGATVLAAALVGCDDALPGPDPDFLEVTPSSPNIEPGDVQQLTATVGGEPVAVTWESEFPNIATVNASGLVTSVSSGVTGITATLTSDPKIRRSATVNVITLQGTSLTKGVGVTLSSSGARGSGQLFRIFVPTGTTSLTFTLRGGSGDADLYARRATPPTNASASHFSFNAGNDEDIVVTNPARGTWYVLVDLWDPYANAVLTATYTP